MKTAKWMLPVTLLLLSGFMAAQSLTSSRVVAQVPFDFMVNNKVIPAGECAAKALSMDTPTLVINNFEARKSVMVLSERDSANAASTESVMVFKQYGDRYFLSSIRIAGSNWVYELPESNLEKELRAENQTATQTVLVASLR
jgi:hypothetical protein